ncbi:MAG: cell division protein ZipA C-terminal FtsZ-binding domain-containing protein, partial [Sulfuricella sp.]
MNELQVSLLVIGFLVIAGVYGFNRIQERKHRRVAEQAFPSGHEDVLLREYESDTQPDEHEMSGFRDDPRIEPVISETADEQEDRMADEVEPTPFYEPEVVEEEADVEVDAQPVPNPSYEYMPSLDDAVDYVVQLHLGEPVGAAALLGMPSLKGLGKRVCWLGLNPLSGGWEEIVPGSSAEYLHVAATLQLADRSGPLFEQDLIAFCNQVQSIADEIVAVAEFPEREIAMARAAELDKFGVEVDVLIGVNVTTQGGEAFAATKIRALAESAGMKLLPDGAFHFFDDDGAELFSLVNRDPT